MDIFSKAFKIKPVVLSVHAQMIFKIFGLSFLEKNLKIKFLLASLKKLTKF